MLVDFQNLSPSDSAINMYTNNHRYDPINVRCTKLSNVGAFWLTVVYRPAIIYFYNAIMFVTAQCYASAVLAVALCPSVCLSVTSRSSTKTAKRRITQRTQHDNPGILVFRYQRSPRNSTGITPAGAPNAGGVGQNRRLSTNSWLYLENGTR